jgi:plastocyanin
VNAEGNALNDQANLRFRPAAVTVALGDVVRWRNTDTLVPHTATEVSGLWDLTGTYGQTPANPPGFGPGETRQRAFEAGTHRYYCKVHPQPMRGSVSVPANLTAGRASVTRRVRRGTRLVGGRRVPRFVNVRVPVAIFYARWSPATPVNPLAFDVEKRIGNGPWKRQVTATRSVSAQLGSSPPGVAWQVRARLRHVNEGSRATDWSPVVTVTG